MEDFRDTPRISAPTLTIIALVAVCAFTIAGYVAVGVWNRAQGEDDPNKVTGYEGPR